VFVPPVRKLGIDAVIGYLIAGLAIGPYGFGLVGEVEGTHRLAELGIVFMLFAIGLELSLDRLRTMARYVFGLGVAQVAITGAVIGVGTHALGGTIGQAAIIGGALALSSTAFVLRLLSERGELSSHLGRVILSVLLLQDLALVPGLAIVTALGQEPEELGWTLAQAGLKATVALIVLLAAGRLLLRPLYRVIAGTRNAELFVAATLLVVLGTAWGSAEADLSMALGAFLAGLMLAGTEYRHQIEADIRPVRGILLGLFFISIGMLVDLRVVLPQLHWILLAVVALVAVKALLLFGLCRVFGLPLPLAASAGLHLAQGGEFAFVLFSLAMGTASLSVGTGQFLLAVVAVSMATTPPLARARSSGPERA
jgi:CPA2 family monovalent cation:H+ antiporter-2